MCRHRRPQLLEEQGLPLQNALVGTQDLLFVLLQLGGDEALPAGDGLLAHVVRGHHGEVRLADLDVIAEDPIEADLEGGDTRTGALALLDGRDGGAAAPADLAQLVELRVDSVADHPALAHRGRRSVDEPRLDLRRHLEGG